MHGIVLAGGSGSRLWPLTRATSKQLLPVYDKPLVFYPLATLMSAKIKNISIITTPQDQNNFKQLLGDGSQLGIKLNYLVQEKPEGLAQAFLIAEKHIANKKTALILGDNLFHGPGLGSHLADFGNVQGAQIFAYRVADPERYGIVEFDTKGQVLSIEEKPSAPRSAYAVPGLYFFDENVLDIAKSIKPSQRGELEITSVNQEYLRNGELKVSVLPRGTAWLDTGTFSSLHEASAYIRALQERQGTLIACLEEIAYRNGWISNSDLRELANSYVASNFKNYLEMLAEEKF